jgi:hypothetical protein
MAEKLKSGLILSEDETLVMELEAELWAASSNPVAQMFGGLSRLIALVSGTRKSGYIVVTNKRVIQVEKTITCYCCGGGKHVKYLLPSSIKEVGFIKQATFGCFCPAYYLYFDSFTGRTQILLKGANESAAQKTVDVLYRTIAQSQAGASVSV